MEYLFCKDFVWEGGRMYDWLEFLPFSTPLCSADRTKRLGLRTHRDHV